MRTWIDVATLAKSRNLDGRFVANPAAGLPFILVEGDEVALVPPKLDVPRRVHVASVRPIDEVRAEIRFEEVMTPDVSQELVGMHCLIKRADIDDEVFEDATSLWEGWTVVDRKEGRVGTVAGIIDNAAQSLIEVNRGESTVLIPAVDEIVSHVDAESKCIHIDAPNGLLDL